MKEYKKLIRKIMRKKGPNQVIAKQLWVLLQRGQFTWTPEKQKKKSKLTDVDFFLIQKLAESILVQWLEQVFSIRRKTKKTMMDAFKQQSFEQWDWFYVVTFEHIPNAQLLKPIQSLQDADLYQFIHQYLQVRRNGPLKQFLVQLFFFQERKEYEKENQIIWYDGIEDTCIVAIKGRKKDFVSCKQLLESRYKKQKLRCCIAGGHVGKTTIRFANYRISITAKRNMVISVCPRYVQQQLHVYCPKHRIIPQQKWMHKQDDEIVALFRNEYMRLSDYFSHTTTPMKMRTFERCLQLSLVKTLALKHQTSVKEVYNRYEKKRITIRKDG